MISNNAKCMLTLSYALNGHGLGLSSEGHRPIYSSAEEACAVLGLRPDEVKGLEATLSKKYNIGQDDADEVKILLNTMHSEAYSIIYLDSKDVAMPLSFLASDVRDGVIREESGGMWAETMFQLKATKTGFNCSDGVIRTNMDVKEVAQHIRTAFKMYSTAGLDSGDWRDIQRLAGLKSLLTSNEQKEWELLPKVLRSILRKLSALKLQTAQHYCLRMPDLQPAYDLTATCITWIPGYDAAVTLVRDKVAEFYPVSELAKVLPDDLSELSTIKVS